jgi:hypothetical protein
MRCPPPARATLTTPFTCAIVSRSIVLRSMDTPHRHAHVLVLGPRAEEAGAFLRREHWLVGTWDIRDDIHTVDLTIRPDGRYIAEESTPLVEGIVRGRYTLEAGRIHLMPFVRPGSVCHEQRRIRQGGAHAGARQLDGELQFIDLDSLSQSVTLARNVPAAAGGHASVTSGHALGVRG